MRDASGKIKAGLTPAFKKSDRGVPWATTGSDSYMKRDKPSSTSECTPRSTCCQVADAGGRRLIDMKE
jgi:hypothetical protein